MIRDTKVFLKQISLYKRFTTMVKRYKQYIQDIEVEEQSIPSTFPETVMINGKLIPIPKAHGDPKAKELYRLALIDKKEQYEKTLEYYTNLVDEVDEVLAMLDATLRDKLVRIYIQKETYESVGRDFHYSKAGLHKAIENGLNEFFDKERTVR